MIKYISTAFSGVGLITNDDQEAKGLKFEVIERADNDTRIKVEGTLANIVEWQSRVSGTDLADFGLILKKRKKIEELNNACNAEILSGHVSSALGVEHEYDFDMEAQMNLAGTMIAITSGLYALPEVGWKTKDSGYLNHTIEQFKHLFGDGLVHKQNKIYKFAGLKAQVEACTTEESVDLIVW